MLDIKNEGDDGNRRERCSAEKVWKFDNYYLVNMEQCNTLFEEVEVMFRYPGVPHVWHQEESSYLTVMDLHNKKYKKQVTIEIEEESPLGLGKRQSK